MTAELMLKDQHKSFNIQHYTWLMQVRVTVHSGRKKKYCQGIDVRPQMTRLEVNRPNSGMICGASFTVNVTMPCAQVNLEHLKREEKVSPGNRQYT